MFATTLDHFQNDLELQVLFIELGNLFDRMSTLQQTQFLEYLQDEMVAMDDDFSELIVTIIQCMYPRKMVYKLEYTLNCVLNKIKNGPDVQDTLYRFEIVLQNILQYLQEYNNI